MSARTRLGVSTFLAAAGLLAALLLSMPHLAQAAAAAPDPALIQAHLEAGEFAPAVAQARGLADPAQRDAWLGRIAAAQARAGALDPSLRSLAEIEDDQVRARAVAGVAGEPLGGRGGGAEADFDSLIDLITSTIRPTTWDGVGGVGSVAPFPTGVYVDPQGVLQPLLKKEGTGRLAALHAASSAGGRSENARRPSPLRKVSLTRLEKQVQLLLAAGRTPDETMQVLAGLQRIQYVFVYPDSRDLVLAGPAGDWQTDAENRIVSTDNGRPVVRLDDLVVVLRHMAGGADARFGCAITPTRDALAKTKAFLEESNKNPIKPHQREKWLQRLRACVGQQDIDVYGLDPRTRAARVMVEADYRMKLVGMGLEEGVPGVQSYLEMVKVPKGMAPPPMDVLRWWFTLDYESVLASPDRRAFEVRGQGVKVLSENELLDAQGQRVHTGKSDELNRQFAHSFTAHFGELCDKYPIYAELRSLFDLALVGALVRSEGLAQQTAWHMTCFGDPAAYRVELGAAPQRVETVINHRVIDRIHILAGVSGGVRVDPASLVTDKAIQTDRDNVLGRHQGAAAPKDRKLSPDAWWWDH
jgi:hypothetical protein